MSTVRINNRRPLQNIIRTLKVKVTVMSDSLQPHGLYSPWNSPGQNTGVGPFPSPGDLPNPGIEPRSPALWVDSLPAEPRGKPKNTGVGSLSLFQGIFPAQESNRGLLHCRWILYQLSYQGNPIINTNYLAWNFLAISENPGSRILLFIYSIVSLQCAFDAWIAQKLKVPTFCSVKSLCITSHSWPSVCRVHIHTFKQQQIM